jgi:hypothetical protein
MFRVGDGDLLLEVGERGGEFGRGDDGRVGGLWRLKLELVLLWEG